MTIASARYKQAPLEYRRYVMDFQLQLNDGETLTSLVPTISSPTGGLLVSPVFVVDNIALASNGYQAIFYAHGGADGHTYEISFIAATSLAQQFQDVVLIDIQEKV